MSSGSWLGNLGKTALKNIAIPLARVNVSGLVSNLTLSAVYKFDRKISEKEFYFFYFKWRCGWYHKNYKIVRRFGCIHWWGY